MPKNILQDVLPPNERSIRKIPLPNGRKVRPVMKRSDRLQMPDDDRHSGLARKVLWGLAGLAVIFAAAAFMSLFSSAKISINPKSATANLDASFVAYPESVSDSNLIYQELSLKKSDSEEVKANGEEAVSQSASGQIIIYNNYSGATQRLIKNTRFQTAEGLVYRIHDSVTVPGRTKSGGVYVPGSVETTVYADEAGEKYNLGLVDFTIPGFKGDPRYQGFYARSKTTMIGGFVGTVKKVEEADRIAALAKVEARLNEALRAEVKKSIPQGFTIFNETIKIGFTPTPIATVDKNTASVGETGELKAVIIESGRLARAVAESTLATFDKKPVEIANLADLKFALVSQGAGKTGSDQALTFTLKGQPIIVWSVDTKALKTDLVGLVKSDTSRVFANYPGIKDASVSVRPFWKSNLPDEENRINIEIVEPKN
ncbi:MAG: hypothetical protein WCT25_01025 [Candidatus Paceibacterota bacterium]|jgi:hypothetical protein